MILNIRTSKSIAVGLCALALVALPLSAYAQVTSPGTPGSTVNKAKGDGDHRKDAEPMRKAGAMLTRAHELLAHALPIYHGKRVDAMGDVKNGIEQIKLGIQWNKLHDDAAVQANTNDNDPASKYTNQQVGESNEKLFRAAKLIEKALKTMEPLEGEYGGHRVTSMKDCRDALGDLKSALNGWRPPKGAGKGAGNGVKKP